MEDLFKIQEWSAKVGRCDFSRVRRRKNERATERRGREGETAGRMGVGGRGGEGVGHVTHRMARRHQPRIRSKLKFSFLFLFFGGEREDTRQMEQHYDWLIDWFSFPSVHLNCEKNKQTRNLLCTHFICLSQSRRFEGTELWWKDLFFLAWRLRLITKDWAKCAICCRNSTAWKDVPDN